MWLDSLLELCLPNTMLSNATINIHYGYTFTRMTSSPFGIEDLHVTCKVSVRWSHSIGSHKTSGGEHTSRLLYVMRNERVPSFKLELTLHSWVHIVPIQCSNWISGNKNFHDIVCLDQILATFIFMNSSSWEYITDHSNDIIFNLKKNKFITKL